MKRLELESRTEPFSVRRARAFVKAALARWDMCELVDTAELLTSEVVTNALVHAGSDFRLTVEVEPPVARVEVTDDSPFLLPTFGDGTNVESEHGRGLLLLQSLADRWGYRSGGGRKTVWFELRREIG